MARVAIIIPHYNDLRRLQLCLKALADQLPVAGHTVEIIVCDNNSPGDLSHVKAEFSGVARFLVETRRGAAFARNTAVDAADCELLLFTDADCVPASGWVSAMIDAVLAHDFCGGPIEVFSEDEGGFNAFDAFERIFAFNQKRYAEALNFVATANMGVRRQTFVRVGPFDHESSEDLDWGIRARDCGVSCTYIEGAAVRHPSRASWSALSKKWQRLTIEDYQTRRKHGASRLQLLLRSIVILVSPIVHGPIVFSKSWLSVREKTSVCGVLVALRVRRAWQYAALALGAARPVKTQGAATPARAEHSAL